MDDGNPPRDNFRSSAVYGAESWDCSRELRSLRDAVARARTEEASALRRNTEEFERNALRRQHDESTALQQFMQGLHENFESKLERHRAHCSGRLDALERRLDGEVERLASLRCEVAAEARLAVREGFEKLDQYIDAPNASGGEAFAQAIQRSLAKVSTDMQNAAVEEASKMAREAAREVAQEVSHAEAQAVSQEIARAVGIEAAKEVASQVAREVAQLAAREVSQVIAEESLQESLRQVAELSQAIEKDVAFLRGEKVDEAARHAEKLDAITERIDMMEDFSISIPAVEGDLRKRLEDIEQQSLQEQLHKLTDDISMLAGANDKNTGIDDLSAVVASAQQEIASLGDRMISFADEVASVEKVAVTSEELAERTMQSVIIAEKLAEQSAESAEHSVQAAVETAEEVAEHSVQDMFARLQQDLSEASSNLRCEIQSVEHDMLGASGNLTHLRCEVQSEIHRVEHRLEEHCDAVGELRLHLDEATATTGQRLEECATQEDLDDLKEDMDELRADLDEAHEEFQAECNAAVARSEATASELDSELRQNLEAIVCRHSEEQSTSLESLQSHAENCCQSNLNVTMESLRELECSEARSLERVSEELREIVEKVQGAGRAEVTNIGKQLREMRQELTIATSQWRTSASDTAQTLGALTASCQSLNSELTVLQSQGLSHEWRIPKCMQRLEYLSMAEDSGVWLDSPSFSLGPLGQLELRLYPRGFRGGDGQCAIGLYAAGVEGLSMVPLQLDLAVQGLRRRAVMLHEDNVGMLWLVQELGRIEGHLTQTEDLTISVEIPARSWGSIDGIACPTHAESRPSPTPARASRSQVGSEESHRDVVSNDDTITTVHRPRPPSTGRISSNPFQKTGNVPTTGGGDRGGGLFVHSSMANSPASEVSFGLDEAGRTARNLHVQQPGSSINSPLGAPAVPKPSWTVFGAQLDGVVPATVGPNSLAAFDSNSSSRSVSTGAVGRRPPASPLAKLPAWGATAERRSSISTNPFDK